MDRNHLLELIEIEKAYWWHVSKREMIKEILNRYFPPPAKLIECGFGTGWNLKFFKALGYNTRGFDILPEAIKHSKKIGIKEVEIHDLLKPWPVNHESYQIVIMLDVLEHLADPVVALKNAGEAIKEKGGIILTVPAIPQLMGPWDFLLSHYRRYSINLLKKQAKEAGLQTFWISYWNFYSIPFAFILRGAEKIFNYRRSTEFPRVPPPINSMLIWLGNIERRLMRNFPIPLGLSLVAVLKK